MAIESASYGGGMQPTNIDLGTLVQAIQFNQQVQQRNRELQDVRTKETGDAIVKNAGVQGLFLADPKLAENWAKLTGVDLKPFTSGAVYDQNGGLDRQATFRQWAEDPNTLWAQDQRAWVANNLGPLFASAPSESPSSPSVPATAGAPTPPPTDTQGQKQVAPVPGAASDYARSQGGAQAAPAGGKVVGPPPVTMPDWKTTPEGQQLFTSLKQNLQREIDSGTTPADLYKKYADGRTFSNEDVGQALKDLAAEPANMQRRTLLEKAAELSGAQPTVQEAQDTLKQKMVQFDQASRTFQPDHVGAQNPNDVWRGINGWMQSRMAQDGVSAADQNLVMNASMITSGQKPTPEQTQRLDKIAQDVFGFDNFQQLAAARQNAGYMQGGNLGEGGRKVQDPSAISPDVLDQTWKVGTAKTSVEQGATPTSTQFRDLPPQVQQAVQTAGGIEKVVPQGGSAGLDEAAGKALDAIDNPRGGASDYARKFNAAAVGQATKKVNAQLIPAVKQTVANVGRAESKQGDSSPMKAYSLEYRDHVLKMLQEDPARADLLLPGISGQVGTLAKDRAATRYQNALADNLFQQARKLGKELDNGIIDKQLALDSRKLDFQLQQLSSQERMAKLADALTLIKIKADLLKLTASGKGGNTAKYLSNGEYLFQHPPAGGWPEGSAQKKAVDAYLGAVTNGEKSLADLGQELGPLLNFINERWAGATGGQSLNERAKASQSVFEKGKEMGGASATPDQQFQAFQDQINSILQSLSVGGAAPAQTVPQTPPAAPSTPSDLYDRAGVQ